MKTKRRRLLLASLGAFGAGATVWALAPDRMPGGTVMIQKLRGKATVSDRLAQYESSSRARWEPHFAGKRIGYPPSKLLLVGLKKERQLQVYAPDSNDRWQLIRSFPIQGLSGKTGPKLRYGDFQVPEGFYRIESLNPNSAYHLALRVNYPNQHDRAQAVKEGRTNLGGDIMIHGSNASIGCLAMGDEVAEDLFVLGAQVGTENIQIVLSPVDFRVADVPQDVNHPKWVEDLYRNIKTALVKLPSR